MDRTKEVYDYLVSDGFNPVEVEDSGDLIFSYEMNGMIYVNNNDDPNYLQILMPKVYECDDDDMGHILTVAMQVTAEMKVAKVVVLNGYVWVVVEEFISDNSIVSDFIPCMLQAASIARTRFFAVMGLD